MNQIKRYTFNKDSKLELAHHLNKRARERVMCIIRGNKPLFQHTNQVLKVETKNELHSENITSKLASK